MSSRRPARVGLRLRYSARFVLAQAGLEQEQPLAQRDEGAAVVLGADAVVAAEALAALAHALAREGHPPAHLEGRELDRVGLELDAHDDAALVVGVRHRGAGV
jgi:hypothetical protein